MTEKNIKKTELFLLESWGVESVFAGDTLQLAGHNVSAIRKEGEMSCSAQFPP